MTNEKELKHLNQALLDDLSSKAKATKRQRLNFNFHDTLDDGIQRLLNAMEPDTYVRPHFHDRDRWEFFQILRGSALILIFDNSGVVTNKVKLDCNDCLGLEIPGGAFHTIASQVVRAVNKVSFSHNTSVLELDTRAQYWWRPPCAKI